MARMRPFSSKTGSHVVDRSSLLRVRGSMHLLLVLALVRPALLSAPEKSVGFPVRGVHLMAPTRDRVDAFVVFIRDGLAKEGVNTLILEFNLSFDFQSRPEFKNPAHPGKYEVAKIVKACREAGIQLIPQISCLGHQSWEKRTGPFLAKHPEFDETPGKYPGNAGIYCRSYCPLHPQVHDVLFALIDELVQACEAKALHAGMDEVFILADPDCPRCRGKDPAELFAGEVKVLHGHLKKTGCRMWMWGDRFLDGQATGIGKWEASENGTAPAIETVPKDIVICDWHYEKAHETPRFFAEKGFDVVACPWRKSAVALGQLAFLRRLRTGSDPTVAGHALGMVQTTWCGSGRFLEAYGAADPQAAGAPAEAVRCFRDLFKALREGQ